jgi:hypothetical protein
MPVSVAVFAHGHRVVRVVVMPFVMAMGVSATEPMAARQAIAATCQNPTCTEMAHQVRCRRQVPAYAADGRLGGDEFGAANVAPGSGRELPLSEFITVKRPLEFRFPEAALRH